jgi:hypothetical protein
VKRGGPFLRGRYNVSTYDLYFAYLERLALQDEKIGWWNSGFMTVGAQSVDVRPERDDQQLTKQNPMSILIFYICSLLSDLLAGRQKFLAHAWSTSGTARVAGRFTGFTARAQNKGGLVFVKFLVKAFAAARRGCAAIRPWFRNVHDYYVFYIHNIRENAVPAKTGPETTPLYRTRLCHGSSARKHADLKSHQEPDWCSTTRLGAKATYALAPFSLAFPGKIQDATPNFAGTFH